jgi:Mg2+-importing ATPase
MKGLTHTEALKRFHEHGPNAISFEHRHTAFEMFFDAFKSPLVIILLVSAALASYFGEVTSSAIIVAIVALSGLLDFVNSYKSNRAAEQLKERVRVVANVLRDGEIHELPLSHIVPGDVVLLAAGNIVPADGKVISAAHFFTNESALSGEAFPQPKDIGAEVFMGSSVATGQAQIEVTATGHATAFSKVVAALNAHERPTEFDREIRDFSFLVLKITICLVLFVFIANTVLKGNILAALLFAVALAVGITPELLPMIITLNLTKGSLAMSRRGVIVKRLSSIQNFGSMNVLCTDKTGTLTEDHIALVKYVDGAGHTSEETLQYAYINSVLSGGYKNPLDDAIHDFRHLSVKGYKKIDELPFDFERRRESVVVEHGGKRLLIAKGAPEGLLHMCEHCGAPSKLMKGTTLKSVQATYEKLSNGGFRVLAIAVKHVAAKEKYSTADEEGLMFVGFVAFLDPPKISVEKTIHRIQESGIAVKIITGDNELVSRRIAREIEFTITGTLLGDEIDDLSDKELKKRVEETNLFARVNPEQKMRIIRTIQSNGNVVGYIGDGINDAPSLKAADVGISVNNAVDIAKESADMILLHKSLEDLVEGVIEGRKTFANTIKYLRMVLSSNFGNVFSMAGATLFLPFLPMLPTQILLNNLIYDVSQFALPLDAVDPDELQKPRRLDLKEIKRFMIIFGPLSSLFDFITFGVLYGAFGLVGSHFQTGWFLESLATQILVVYVIRTRRIPFLESRPGMALVIATLGGLVLAWSIGLSRVGTLFGFSSVGVAPLMAIGLIVMLYLFVIEIAKQRFFRKFVQN